MAELTDDELLDEVNRRRSRRAQHTTHAQEAAPSQTRPVPRRVKQWLANLELPDTASLGDVERAFDALHAKYEPMTHTDDEKKNATAKVLLGSLRTAYEKLRLHFAQQG